MQLTIELEETLVEKELDRAARSLSQKVRVPGFRPGKAPRAILERFYGRPALVEEATDGIINSGFRKALEQEGIEPIAQASVVDVQFANSPYTFVVHVPVEPITKIPDYSGIKVPYTVPAVTDEVLQRALDDMREKHVVLREPEESRAAQQGDLVSAEVDVRKDGTSINGRVEGQPAPSTDLILEPGRLIPGLMEGVVGMNVGDHKDIDATMPDDYSDESLRGAKVVFDVTVRRIQERILPDWDELPTLEESEGSLADLKHKTSDDLAKNARQNAENRVVTEFIDSLVAGAEFDYSDIMIQQEADRLLQSQEAEYVRYGTTAEAVYKQMGRSRDEFVTQMLPQGEERLKRNLVMREFITAEGITIGDDDIDAEIEEMVSVYPAEQHEMMKSILRSQLLTTVANGALDKKVRARIIEVAGIVGDATPAPKKKSAKKGVEESAPAAEAPKKKSAKKDAEESAPAAEAPKKKSAKKDAEESAPAAEAPKKKSAKKAE
jgi:trigger factor